VDVFGVNIAVDQRTRIHVMLQPGAVTESITMAGESADQLGAETSSLGNIINPSQSPDLPLPNRNILNLLSLTAGVSGCTHMQAAPKLKSGAHADDASVISWMLKAGAAEQ